MPCNKMMLVLSNLSPFDKDIVPSLFYDLIEYHFILDGAEQFMREKYYKNSSDSQMTEALITKYIL